jgi:hypothetical protein
MTVDMVHPIFSYGTEKGRELVDEFRFRMFEEVAQSDWPGLIFTFLWAFDEVWDKEYIEKIVTIFKQNNSEIYFIELEADIEARKIRNTHEFRLSKKPTKQNTEMSYNNMMYDYENHRLNSELWEIKYKNYLRINNTHIWSKETAKKIFEYFSL